MNYNAIEQARHEDDCRTRVNEALQTEKPNKSELDGSNRNTNAYFCQMCRKEFAFSKIEILRHRQKHTLSDGGSGGSGSGGSSHKTCHGDEE